MAVSVDVNAFKVPKGTTVRITVNTVVRVKAIACKGPSFEFAIGRQPSGQPANITERLLRDDTMMVTDFFLDDGCLLVYANNSSRDYVGFYSVEVNP